jgi:hypothetical protein
MTRKHFVADHGTCARIWAWRPDRTATPIACFDTLAQAQDALSGMPIVFIVLPRLVH